MHPFISTGLTIGFESVSQSVSEDAGSVSVCVRILHPAGTHDIIENRNFILVLNTVDPHNASQGEVISYKLLWYIESFLSFSKRSNVIRFHSSLQVIDI